MRTVLLAIAISLVAAVPAAGDPPRSVSPYYLGRADPRLCPSPECGGVWVRLVNERATPCGGFTSRECYVASVDASRIRVSEILRTRLVGLVAGGAALARGKLVQGRVAGFPQLRTLVATEIWPASSAPGPSEGPVWKLRDNGIRCFAAPCFSIDAIRLNSGHRTTISGLDLSRTRTTLAERDHAREGITEGTVAVAGRIARVPNAGPAGTGRVLVASQFYVQAGS
jgi:hypothetical protein